MRLHRKRRAQQQEGEVAVFWDSTRLLTGELKADGFQTVMAGNVPNPQLLAQANITSVNSMISYEKQ